MNKYIIDIDTYNIIYLIILKYTEWKILQS